MNERRPVDQEVRGRAAGKKKRGIRGYTRTTHVERNQASVDDASLFGFDGRLGSFQ
jgi:ribosome assembly protein YihI (activator of Der GTPase)